MRRINRKSNAQLVLICPEIANLAMLFVAFHERGCQTVICLNLVPECFKIFSSGRFFPRVVAVCDLVEFGSIISSKGGIFGVHSARSILLHVRMIKEIICIFLEVCC